MLKILSREFSSSNLFSLENIKNTETVIKITNGMGIRVIIEIFSEIKNK